MGWGGGGGGGVGGVGGGRGSSMKRLFGRASGDTNELLDKVKAWDLTEKTRFYSLCNLEYDVTKTLNVLLSRLCEQG